nr:zinc finger, CCHC-type [Tanacetum cinerariifolium]
MHSIGKTLAELHAIMKLHEKGIPKKAKTPTMLAIREGRIQKDKKKKPQGAKGKGKGKNKLAYDPKPKISPPPKREHSAKDSICHHCIFTIELYAFPNKTWVYDTGCGTHICNTSQGLKESRKLKHEALSLYMGNGMRAFVEAFESFDLIIPSGLIIILDNCHFAPTVTRGVALISRLVNNGYVHTFTNYGIFVSKDIVFCINEIPHDEKTLKKFRMENSKKGYTLIMEKPDYKKSQGAKTPTDQNPDKIHWTTVKIILKYLRNTKDMVPVCRAKPKDELKVSCYADASFHTDKDDTKSQTEYVFVLNGGAVDWKSAK